MACCVSAGMVAALTFTGTGLAGSRSLAARITGAPTIKPGLTGLLDRGSQAPYRNGQPFPPANPNEVRRDAAAFSGIVVNETWAQLEPAQGVFTFASIRQSLAAVKRYNRGHPGHPLGVRLRVFGGVAAPQWAKTIDGSPITVPTKVLTSGSGTVGQWWKPAYRAAWATLQHALAARFDNNALIRSVAVSSCSTITAEPFVFPMSRPVRAQLYADGWSMSGELQCLQGAFSDYSGWKHTSIDYTFNPLPGLGKSPGPDVADTNAVMSQCARLLASTGRDCELANHALDEHAASTAHSAPVYSEINHLYRQHRGRIPVDFQTINDNRFGGCQAIAVAIHHHARAVELWPPNSEVPGYAAFPQHTLRGWAQAIQRGKAPHC